MTGLWEEPEEIERPSHGIAIKLVITYVAVALVPLIMSGYIPVAYFQEFAGKVKEGVLAADELDRYVRNAKSISIMVGIFAMLIGIAMSFLITGWIIGPLRQISRFLIQAAQHRNFLDRVDLPLRDEIGYLASNINKLLDAVIQTSSAQRVVCSECGASGDASDKFCRRCGREMPL